MRIILQECKMDLLRAVRYRVGMISDLVLFVYGRYVKRQCSVC